MERRDALTIIETMGKLWPDFDGTEQPWIDCLREIPRGDANTVAELLIAESATPPDVFMFSRRWREWKRVQVDRQQVVHRPTPREPPTESDKDRAKREFAALRAQLNAIPPKETHEETDTDQATGENGEAATRVGSEAGPGELGEPY